jgi:hypothetical protein
VILSYPRIFIGDDEASFVLDREQVKALAGYLTYSLRRLRATKLPKRRRRERGA